MSDISSFYASDLSKVNQKILECSTTALAPYKYESRWVQKRPLPCWLKSRTQCQIATGGALLIPKHGM